jgi:DNA-binding beta-propeller fold protein YncE
MMNFDFHKSRAALLLNLLFTVLFVISCGKRAEPSPKTQPPPPPFEFLGAWGDKGDGPGKFSQPVAFATDALGNLFFADPSAGLVDKFEPKGVPLLSFEDPGLHQGSGIAVDTGGAIYVADAKRGTIRIFFPDGTFFKTIQSAPQPGFSGTLGISVDDTGKLYVPDPTHSRIVKFDAQGRLVKSWSAPQNAAPGELPMAVSAEEDGSLFVEFAKTGRIEKYSSDGMWLNTWTATNGLAGGSNLLTGFTVANQLVFTLTVSPPHIRVWNLDGQQKLEADLGDHFAATVASTAPVVPAALQIAATPNGELLVFDPAGSRVYRFQMYLEKKEIE